MVTLQELTVWDKAFLPDFQALMRQLNPDIPVSEAHFIRAVTDPGSHLFVVRDGDRIIGCATLCVFHSPTGRKASVEDVVVLDGYRGQHLGRQLMDYLLTEARRFSPLEVHLTSRPSREAANALYRSLGFVQRETNAYQIII